MNPLLHCRFQLDSQCNVARIRGNLESWHNRSQPTPSSFSFALLPSYHSTEFVPEPQPSYTIHSYTDRLVGCPQAKKKVAEKGWQNVHVVEADACTFTPPGQTATLVTFSYSLSSALPSFRSTQFTIPLASTSPIESSIFSISSNVALTYYQQVMAAFSAARSRLMKSFVATTLLGAH